MGDQLFLKRFIWFDSETRHGHHPNTFKLAAKFEISNKTAQRSIDYFRDRLQAPLAYLLTRKGYVYTDPAISCRWPASPKPNCWPCSYPAN